MPAAKCTQNGGFIPSAQQLQTTESLNFESVPFSILWVAMTPECENGLWRNADLAPDRFCFFFCRVSRRSCAAKMKKLRTLTQASSLVLSPWPEKGDFARLTGLTTGRLVTKGREEQGRGRGVRGRLRVTIAAATFSPPLLNFSPTERQTTKAYNPGAWVRKVLVTARRTLVAFWFSGALWGVTSHSTPR